MRAGQALPALVAGYSEGEAVFGAEFFESGERGGGLVCGLWFEIGGGRWKGMEWKSLLGHYAAGYYGHAFRVERIHEGFWRLLGMACSCD
jgi:hypothetical protein